LIAELKDSKTVLVSYHANDPNAGMSNAKDIYSVPRTALV